MNKKAKKIILITILYTISFITINITNTISHELAHKKISEYHGCKESIIKYNFLGTSTHKCIERDNFEEKKFLQEKNLHSLNEIIGYNLQSIINSFLLLFFIKNFILIIEKEE